MIALEKLDRAIENMPYLAILRGVQPDQVLHVAEVLVDMGIRSIEIPINSPQPFVSIASLRREYGDDILVGCGTATTVDHVEKALEAGADLVVQPHADVHLVQLAVKHGKVSVPGICTPTEAFNVLDAGATALKLFPSEMIPPHAVAAMKAILPADTRLISVGGISAGNLKTYWDVGVRAFGLGSTIYKSGMGVSEVREAFAPLADLGRELVNSSQSLVGT